MSLDALSAANVKCVKFNPASQTVPSWADLAAALCAAVDEEPNGELPGLRVGQVLRAVPGFSSNRGFPISKLVPLLPGLAWGTSENFPRGFAHRLNID